MDLKEVEEAAIHLWLMMKSIWHHSDPQRGGRVPFEQTPVHFRGNSGI